MDARRTETCVVPVDASRDYYLVFFERAAWGMGVVRCQTFYLSLFSLFSRPRAGLATVLLLLLLLSIHTFSVLSLQLKKLR